MISAQQATGRIAAEHQAILKSMLGDVRQAVYREKALMQDMRIQQVMLHRSGTPGNLSDVEAISFSSVCKIVYFASRFFGFGKKAFLIILSGIKGSARLGGEAVIESVDTEVFYNPLLFPLEQDSGRGGDMREVREMIYMLPSNLKARIRRSVKANNYRVKAKALRVRKTEKRENLKERDIPIEMLYGE